MDPSGERSSDVRMGTAESEHSDSRDEFLSCVIGWPVRRSVSIGFIGAQSSIDCLGTESVGRLDIAVRWSSLGG